MKVEVVQEDKKGYDGKKMIIWIPECSTNALKCLGGDMEMTVKIANQSDDEEDLLMKRNLEDAVESLEPPTSLLYPRIYGVWMNEEIIVLY